MNEETARLPDYRVIISGGRDFNDFELMKNKCDLYLSQKRETHRIVVVSGTARGADSLGEHYARLRGFGLQRYPANWDRDGKAAGPIRNALMARNADALIAFFDGSSRGTANMIQSAKERGLPVKIVQYKYKEKMPMQKEEIIQLKWDELLQYAKEHATGEGFHRGYAWLKDAFNEYLNMSDSTPGYGMGGQPGSHFNREVLSGRILQHFNGVGADHVLSDEQLSQLKESLSSIVQEQGQESHIKR